MSYQKMAARLAKKLESLTMEAEELRHGTGSDELSPEERTHVAAMHRAIVAAHFAARSPLPLTEDQELALRRESAQAAYAGMMG